MSALALRVWESFITLCPRIFPFLFVPQAKKASATAATAGAQ